MPEAHADTRHDTRTRISQIDTVGTTRLGTSSSIAEDVALDAIVGGAPSMHGCSQRLSPVVTSKK